MYAENVTIINKTGIHARPASEFVKKAKTFSSEIKVVKLGGTEEETANAKAIFSVLRLALIRGTTIRISAEGEDEENAVKSLVELVKNGFGE